MPGKEEKEEITLKLGDETVKIISDDGRSFYVNKDVACVSRVISNRLLSDFRESQTKEIDLHIDGDTLEKWIEYMHYKFINSQRKVYETPDNPVDEEFHIDPEEALSLLKAGIYLEC